MLSNAYNNIAKYLYNFILIYYIVIVFIIIVMLSGAYIIAMLPGAYIIIMLPCANHLAHQIIPNGINSKL